MFVWLLYFFSVGERKKDIYKKKLLLFVSRSRTLRKCKRVGKGGKKEKRKYIFCSGSHLVFIQTGWQRYTSTQHKERVKIPESAFLNAYIAAMKKNIDTKNIKIDENLNTICYTNTRINSRIWL